MDTKTIIILGAAGLSVLIVLGVVFFCMFSVSAAESRKEEREAQNDLHLANRNWKVRSVAAVSLRNSRRGRRHGA